MTTRFYTRSRTLATRLGLKRVWSRAAHFYVWHYKPLVKIDSKGKALFQVVGLPRSGTTLLANLITNHPDALCLSEPYRSWFLHGAPVIDGKHSSRHPTDIIEELCASRSETHIGLKETYFSDAHAFEYRNGHFFQRNALGGFKTVVIVRDPRDNYASIEDMAGMETTVRPRFLHSWFQLVAWGQEHADVMIRYEDLVSSPAAEMKRVLSAIHLPEEIPSLNPAQDFVGEGDPDAFTKAHISTKSVGSYRRRLSTTKIKRIEQECGPVMKKLGYKLGPANIPVAVTRPVSS